MPNSFQTPRSEEPGGGQWHKIKNPGTGWFANKTAGWTADRLSTATGGLAVDFSPLVPVGTRAVFVTVNQQTAAGAVYYRKWGDNIQYPGGIIGV